MFVACSTLCFTKESLESALRHIVELEFQKIDLAIHESGTHLRLSEVADNPEAALLRLRSGPSLTPASLDLNFGGLDAAAQRKRYEAMCRFAKALTVAVLTIPAAPLGTPVAEEIARLSDYNAIARRDGLVLTLGTHGETLTGDPAVALALCEAVPGLALTLDPSHYINGPHAGASFDALFPFVQHVQLRDTGKRPGEFQVKVGQGQVDYSRIVSLLERCNYKRALSVAILDDRDNPFDVEVETRKLKLMLESLL